MHPNNYIFNLKYAEILYSMGNSGDNFESLLLSRKYFTHSLTLCNEKNKNYKGRALWGLL